MSRAAETTPARFLGIAEGTGFLGRPLTLAERYGFEQFFRAQGPRHGSSYMGEEYDAGWSIAAQVCFAQGAVGYLRTGGAAVPPYPYNTPAFAAHRDGFNAMANKALDIED